MMRTPRRPSPSKQSGDLVFATIDRLTREKSELLEEIRQLRAAVAIYRRVVEQVTGRAPVDLPPTGTS